MRKWIIFLAVIVFMMAGNLQHTFAASEAIGVIRNYETVAQQISITRAVNHKSSPTRIYNGDRITGNLNAVDLILHPYADKLVEGNSWVIVYKPPGVIQRMTDSVMDLLSQFQRTVEHYSYAVSLAPTKTFDLTPQPGFDMTMLTGQKITFSWRDNADNKTFTIKDSAGNKILEKDIHGQDSLELDPTSLQFEVGKEYFWGVDVDPQNCKMTLLDKAIETEILAQLAEFDAQDIPENECLLKKIEYVQFLSATYPEQVDLYWLSAQWLTDFKATTKEDRSYKRFLLDKCKTHLKEEFVARFH